MKQIWKTIANYGLSNQTTLEEFDTRSEAERWAKGYTREGNRMCGWDIISVGYHDTDGEWIETLEFSVDE